MYKNGTVNCGDEDPLVIRAIDRYIQNGLIVRIKVFGNLPVEGPGLSSLLDGNADDKSKLS
jgi:hypothetical protein